VALVLLLLGGLGLPARPAQAEAHLRATKRVVVFDIQAGELSDPEIDALPDVIGKLIGSRPGFQVIPAAESHQALAVGEARESGCALSDACRAQIAQELRADLALSGSFTRGPRGYVLSLVLVEPGKAQSPTLASESMRLRKSLQLNVRLCVDRLLESETAPAAATATTTKQRVVIFQVPSDGVSGPEAAQVPDLIARVVASHPEYDVVSGAERDAGLQVADTGQPGCADSETCRARVASTLGAELVISASFERHRPGYRLSVSVTGPGTHKGPPRTSESMRLLTSLPLNVTLCLNRLFGWNDGPELFAVKPTPAAVVSVEPPPAPPATGADAAASPRPSEPAPEAGALAPPPPVQADEFFPALPPPGSAQRTQERALRALTAGSRDVLFGSGSTLQHWVLLDASGVPFDRLPCRHIVPAQSGWKLKLAADQTEAPVTLDLPSSFDFPAGQVLLVLPRKPFLPALTVPGSTERVLLWVLGLGGVAAFEVLGGLFEGGGAAIGSNATPPNPAVGIPLLASGGALLITVVALQALAHPGLEVTSLPGG
jgi:hypothetical protein